VLTFGSGFACNVAVVGALMRAGDLICSDALNHASIVDGCRLSGARTAVYRHRDTGHLADRLEDAPSDGKTMVVTDSVFSMEGDVAPLAAIVDLADRHGAFVMLDEAHATGVLGRGGRGTLAHLGLEGRVPVLMGTLGKALGSVGGYIAGSRDLIDYLARSARSFLFTTAPPPAAAAAALAALRILRGEPERVDRLWTNARLLHGGLAGLGFTLLPEPAPILPVLFADDVAASRASAVLFDHGVVAHAVGPPYVPEGTSRLRLIVSAAHDERDVEAVLAAFGELAAGRERP
jgi:8-amino-7-oxononanoate synthase